MSKKILVTGGTGYIGSHTVVELQESGYEVVVVDDLSNSSIDVLDNIEKITGKKPAFENFDLADRKKLAIFFNGIPESKPLSILLHSKAVGESVEKPLHYYRNNLVSMMNLIECQIKYGVPHMVFSSSCTVYGQPDHCRLPKNTPERCRIALRKHQAGK
jgi:UDP-glucose 4-epimerase